MKTIQGYVAPLPKGGDGRWQVAVVDGDVEYHVAPRGAGVDLAEHLSEQVEVQATLIEDAEPDGPLRIQVRSYRLIDQLDDDAWYEDDEA
jgi:hypothetical protein